MLIFEQITTNDWLKQEADAEPYSALVANLFLTHMYTLPSLFASNRSIYDFIQDNQLTAEVSHATNCYWWLLIYILEVEVKPDA